MSSAAATAPPSAEAAASFIELDLPGGRQRLEVVSITPPGALGGAPQDAPVLVFLHEGLGSVAAWRQWPQQLCAQLGARGVMYSRLGYGQSTPLATPRTPRYLHDEAWQVLPALLAALGIERPLLVGHSDGGSIALLYAARCAPHAIAVMAPHVWVEAVTLAGVRAARISWSSGAWDGALARVHADPRGAFLGWNDTWLDPAFRDWNIEAELATVRCPVLAIQGRDDQYGTLAQLDRIAAAVSGPCRTLALDRCGHAPQRDQPDAVNAAIGALYAEVAAS